jgi:hypothetical protein
MTKPKMKPCKGKGQKVYGADGQWGTVSCTVCGTSGLAMKTTTTADRKKEFSVPEHECRAHPFRPKKGVRALLKGRESRRYTGRH